MNRKKKLNNYPITEQQEQIMKMFLLKIKEDCDELCSMLNELNKIVMDFYNEDTEEDKIDPDSGEYNFD